ncbi:MAG: polysaccharide deacetylase family protein [Nannocystales bacterium]
MARPPLLSKLLVLGTALSVLSCKTEGPVVTPPTCPAPEVPEAIAPPIEPAPERAQLGPLQIAITVDDLPAHGPVVPGLSALEVHRALLTAFEAHSVPQVYGFVNAGKLEGHPERRAALEAWTAAGHPLGNHTYNHLSLRDKDLKAYFQDIAANEPLLEELALNGSRTPTFRYPFLLEGMSREDTIAIRKHLEQRGYRNVPVTIDFYDWAFNPPYARCRKIGDKKALAALRKTFVDHAVEMLEWSDAAAQSLYGRRIPHVLLLHSGAFDAEMIEPLLTALEARDVQWISLDDALEDPIYEERPTVNGRNQGTLLDQKIDADDAPHPPWNRHPRALLEALCPERD